MIPDFCFTLTFEVDGDAECCRNGAWKDKDKFVDAYLNEKFKKKIKIIIIYIQYIYINE